MAADGFTWVPGLAPPRIEPHSAAKLRVLRGYLAHYLDRLATNPAMDALTVSFVDGFCGGGTFTQGANTVPGSPIVMLEEVEAARERLNRRRAKPLQVNAKFHLVDIERRHIEHLRQELIRRGYLGRLGNDIELVCSPFGEVLPESSRTSKAGMPGAARSSCSTSVATQM